MEGKTIAVKKKKELADVKQEIKIYKCMSCGAEWDSATGHFFKTSSKMYTANDNYYPVCLHCLRDRFKELSNRYDERFAMLSICHYMDIPFYYSLYSSMITKSDNFSIGVYCRQMHNKQYSTKTFLNTLLDRKELGIDEAKYEEIKEDKWSASEHRTKENVVDIIGYDPFEGYSETQRKFLFNDIIGYLNEDGIEDDTYKISQIIQLVNNNYQILQLNTAMAKLNPVQDSAIINDLNPIMKRLVDSNNKIAKENGISVNNRIDKEAGRSTLTYRMKYMREIDLAEAQANYYSQLRSEGTQWVADMSLKAIRSNGFFDENDFKDIMESQYQMIQRLQNKLDDAEEENRLLIIANDELRSEIK